MPAVKDAPSSPPKLSTTYSVPDDSENDSESDASEASVAFIKRRSRVFSVPSSDSESDDDRSVHEAASTSSKEKAKGDEVHSGSVSSPPPTSEPASPKIDRSARSEDQYDTDSYPSEMDEISSILSDSPSITSSDDEGPEVLPIDEGVKTCGAIGSEFSQASAGSSMKSLSEEDADMTSVNKQKEAKTHLVISEEREVQAAAKLPGLGLLPDHDGKPLGGLWAPKLNPSLSEKRLGKQPEAPSVADVSCTALYYSDPSFQPKLGKPALRTSTSESQQYPYAWPVAPEENPSLHQGQGFFRARSPSPSDAALARNASRLNAKMHPDSWPGNNGWWNSSQNLDCRNPAYVEPFYASEDYVSWKPSSHPMGRGDEGYPYDDYSCDGLGNGLPSSPVHPPWNVNQGSPYVDGPFAGSDRIQRSTNISKPEQPTHRGVVAHQTSAANSAPHNTIQRLGSTAKLTIPGVEKDKSDTSKGFTASKLNISSLVDTAAPIPEKNLKRKVDLINQEELTIQNKNDVTVIPSNSTVPVKKIIMKTKAQSPVMRFIGKNPDAMAGATSKGERGSTANDKTSMHAAKRAKVGSSRTTGLTRFALGVGVGALSVVGAFVASIPASVRNEAWREFQNVQ